MVLSTALLPANTGAAHTRHTTATTSSRCTLASATLAAAPLAATALATTALALTLYRPPPRLRT